MKKRDLRSMANRNQAAQAQRASNRQKQAPQKIPEGMEGEAEKWGDMAQQFQGKSQDELLGELMKRSAEKKADGSLTGESLETFFNNASPMLTADQRKNMRKLIDKIK